MGAMSPYKVGGPTPPPKKKIKNPNFNLRILKILCESYVDMDMNADEYVFSYFVLSFYQSDHLILRFL